MPYPCQYFCPQNVLALTKESRATLACLYKKYRSVFHRNANFPFCVSFAIECMSNGSTLIVFRDRWTGALTWSVYSGKKKKLVGPADANKIVLIRLRQFFLPELFCAKKNTPSYTGQKYLAPPGLLSFFFLTTVCSEFFYTEISGVLQVFLGLTIRMISDRVAQTYGDA